MKKIKIFIAIIILISTILISNNIYAEGMNLSDIDNHWAKKDILTLIEQNCINGYSDGTFKPDNKITVGEFTKILITSLGFTDIKNSKKQHWALNYINKAKELKIIYPYEFIDYDRNIKRGEIARMVVRSIDEKYPETIEYYSKKISDYKEISNEYKGYVLKAFQKGIVTGYEDNSFKPQRLATRAESCVMIIRMLQEDRRIPPKKINIVSENISKKEMEEIIERLRGYGTNSRYDHDSFEEDNYASLNLGWSWFIDKVYQDTINNMTLLHNRDYRTINKEKYKKELLYYLHATWFYSENEYHPKDFINKYIQDTIDYKIIVESEFITDEKLIHSDKWGSPTIRGVFRFRYINHDNPQNILNELELNSNFTKNKGFPKEFKKGQWYEVDMDIHLSRYLTNLDVTWDNSRYMFKGYEYLSEFREIEIE